MFFSCGKLLRSEQEAQVTGLDVPGEHSVYHSGMYRYMLPGPVTRTSLRAPMK